MKKAKSLKSKCNLKGMQKAFLLPKIIRSKSRAAFLIVSCFFIIGSFQLKSQTIPGLYCGINGWMPASIGTVNINGHVNASELCASPPNNVVGELGTKIMRYGGAASDFTLPTIAQYTAFVDMARDNNMEPLIQIPFLYTLAATYNPTLSLFTNISNAVALAGYTADVQNIVTTLKASPYNVKYWGISNEPDLWYNVTNSVVPSASSASQVANYFKTISAQIKSADANAIIVGPDLNQAYPGNGIMHDLIGGTPSINITGTITGMSPTRYYCDIYAFHTYPFSGTQSSVDVIGHPSSTLTSGFAGQLSDMRAAITNSASNPNLKIAVTEFNVDWQNNASNTYSNVSANSFLAGQWMAEMFSVGLTKPNVNDATVEFMLPWSIHEQEGDRSTYDLSILDDSYANGVKKRSTYNHIDLLAESFYGGDVL